MTINWFVSVDDHLIEPARLWQDRLPERWKDTSCTRPTSERPYSTVKSGGLLKTENNSIKFL